MKARVWVSVTLLAALHYLLRLGFGIGDAAPDLLAVALLVAAREVHTGTAAGIGFFFGLLEDAFNALAFGANTVALTLLGALGAGTRDLFVGDSPLFVVSYLFFGKWVRDFVFWVAAGEAVREPFIVSVLIRAPLAALYVAALGLVVMWISGAWTEERAR